MNNVKFPTAAEMRRETAERAQLRCMRVLGWDEDAYNNFWIDSGCDYLEIICKGDHWSIQGLKESNIFWKWWLNHWSMREEEFSMDYQKLMDFNKRIVTESYKSIHNVKALADEIYPNAVVMGDSYAEMIDKINKGEI